MSKFAKLIDLGNDQVLVRAEDDGGPGFVVIVTICIGGVLVEIAADRFDTVAQAYEYLQEIEESTAKLLLEKLMGKVSDFLGDDDNG